MAEMKPKKKFGFADLFIFVLLAIIVVGVVISITKGNNKQETISETELFERIQTGEITTIYGQGVKGDGNDELFVVVGNYSDSYYSLKGYSTYYSVITVDEYNLIITKKLSGYYSELVVGDFTVTSTFSIWDLLSVLVPAVILIFGIIFLVKSSAQSGNAQAFDFGKSRARLAKKTGITFKDVAGLDEEKEEVVELVDFLKNPKKYLEMGARIPKGVLLVGNPGTGKTLLARACAGEANVPFYTISGSDFVEMFVGVGASRVRDMFNTAKKNAPCIVFIDEIDAVGRQRGTGLGGGHDEREQTLNQLLVEMDGFSNNSGIIVMAATNRADVLDPALLRPGRFDRQITIGLPDLNAREAILRVHARNKNISNKVNLLDIARRTPSFSGADLENLLNEAALLAAREDSKQIKIYHIDEAIDRVMMGPAKKSRHYNEQEKAVVAYHEAGHAVVGIKLKHASIVQKVTIIPRGDAGGYNLMTPTEETFLQTKTALTAQITGLLAGRIAETIVFGEMTTGAHNDFQKATAIARAMVTEYGMSDLGPIQYERQSGSVFLGRDYMTDKNFSDQVALEIDEAVRKLVNECYEKGVQIINENRQLLDLIAKHLVEIETLTKEDIDELVNTGKLEWWEKKKAKLEEAKAAAEAETQEVTGEVVDSTEVKPEETLENKEEKNE